METGVISLKEAQYKYLDIEDLENIPIDSWPSFLYYKDLDGETVGLLGYLLEKWKSKPPKRVVLEDFLKALEADFYVYNLPKSVLAVIIKDNCEYSKKILDLLIYFGADIKDAKEHIDKIYEEGMVDYEIIKLLEIKKKKYKLNICENILLNNIDRKYAVVNYDDILGHAEVYYQGNGERDEYWDELVGYNKQYELININPTTIEYKKYFDKVEAGKKIARFIKDKLDDEFEMKPLRTKIDYEKMMEILADH
jgi:hypothetical protein